MIVLRKTQFVRFNTLARLLCTLALMGIIDSSQAQRSDGTPVPLDGRASLSVPAAWQSGEAVHLIGLPEIREKERGSLSISPAALTFASLEGQASVPRVELLNVSVGDVSVETGGTVGKITRAVIPFGGGTALATVTHKQISILTIEFRDQRGALHGAVFLLPKGEALQAQQQLGAPTPPHLTEPSQGRCETNGGSLPDAIKVAAITTVGAPIPAEYSVLIYEQLVRRLHNETRFTAVYRDGDREPEATCPKYNLVLTLNAFKKGNAVERASTGPVGFFIGATKLKFHLQVQDVSGRIIFDKEFQASKRGDTDSLDIAEKIAKMLTKEARKGSLQAARS